MQRIHRASQSVSNRSEAQIDCHRQPRRGEQGESNLSGGDFQSAKLFHDVSDTAGRYTLEIHFGDRAFERLVDARTSLQKGGIERFRRLSGLRYFELHLTKSAFEGSVLESVAVTVSVFRRLARRLVL